MRRATTSVLLAVMSTAVAVGIGTPAATAHGAKSEIYTAEAPVPFPSFAGCTGGEEGASKESHPFQFPASGQLRVNMSAFTGDWDLYLLNENGFTITSSTLPQPEEPAFESVSALVKANQAVTIVACNWSGGPSATVDFAFTRAPLVSVGDVAVHEGDGGTRAAVFTVSLSEPSNSTVAVDYATVASGAASAPGDFTAKSGTVTFAAGTTHAAVKVPVAGDTADEANEVFSLALSAPTGAVIVIGSGRATILDDDPATPGPRLAVGDVNVHEGDSGSRTAVFNVSLSAPSTSTVTVSFSTAKGTASGADFKSKSGALSFAPGTTSMNVKVAITPDTITEGSETFNVVLSGASGAALADATGLATIVDND